VQKFLRRIDTIRADETTSYQQCNATGGEELLDMTSQVEGVIREMTIQKWYFT